VVDRRRTRELVLLVVLGVVAGLLAPLSIGAAPAAAVADDRAHAVRRPVLRAQGFADPSVVRWHGGYVGVATGPLAPRAVAASPAGPWTPIASALTRRPRWASGRSTWAGDLVKVRGRWLLYYSAPVRGLGPGGRCIGVATARSPVRRFHPVGSRPLVCPHRDRGRAGQDRVPGRARALPRRGVIDAEGVTVGRRRYLVYRTQGRPATIRMVRLSRGGLRVPHGRRSHQLVRADHIVENPTLLRRGRGFYLLTSEGSYGDCGYRTTWRRTTSLWDWSRSRPHRLLDQHGTGLCGPGGTDVLARSASADPASVVQRAMVFLHAWTCPGLGACPRGVYGAVPGGVPRRVARMGARRSLYAAWMWWHRGRPRVTSFVVPARG
jgi:hypothetical protein